MLIKCNGDGGAQQNVFHLSVLPPGIEPGPDVSLMFHPSYHWTTVVDL